MPNNIQDKHLLHFHRHGDIKTFVFYSLLFLTCVFNDKMEEIKHCYFNQAKEKREMCAQAEPLSKLIQTYRS